MNIFYVLSVIYLLVLFLLYRKTDKKICLLSSIIYAIGMLFCYNTLIVFILYLLKINGSMLIYSLVNYIIGSILLFFIFRLKERQKYYFDKNKFLAILGLGIIVFFIGYFRFDGFRSINYESGDSAIHYRHALEFSEELSILDKTNSQDDVFNYFVRVMPISYVNCGLLFNIFSTFKTYILFSYYNVFVLMICSLVFLITIIDVFKCKKKDYIFTLIFSLFYVLAFPYNNFIMGFCYLSLSIMVINLLFFTMFHFKDNLNEGIIFKIINMFLLTFACFYSYYLFVPSVYLSLGLYYILLWRKKELSFKKMILYGITTLIIPFIMGFCYFLVTLFVDEGISTVTELINMWGYSYNNVTPIYLFILLSGYLMFVFKGKKKFNYLELNICIVSLYVFIFLILYVLKLADLYYFYKLFSLYWLIIMLFLLPKIMKFRRIFYGLILVLLIVNIFVYNFYDSKISGFIAGTNIYSWNTSVSIEERVTYDSEELKILEKSMEFEDICVYDDRFLILGSVYKNLWFYSITDNIPIFTNVNGDFTNFNQVTNNVPNFRSWSKALLNYDCLIYYYEGEKEEIDRTKYEFLYENEKGVIIKRVK